MPSVILKLSEYDNEVFDAYTIVEVEVSKHGDVTHDTFSFYFSNKEQ